MEINLKKKMKQWRTFKEYIKKNGFWMTFTITIMTTFFAVLSFLQGVPFMGWFCVVVLLFTWIGSYVDWKTKG